MSASTRSASARFSEIVGGSPAAGPATSAATARAATTKAACRLRAREAIPHTTLDRRTGRGRYVIKAPTLAAATDTGNREVPVNRRKSDKNLLNVGASPGRECGTVEPVRCWR